MKNHLRAAGRCVAHCWHLLAPEFLAYVAPDPRLARKPAPNELISQKHSLVKQSAPGK